MLINHLSRARLDNACTDPGDPRCGLPFCPDTARRFYAASLGQPRLFNRLGSTVLSTAADLVQQLTQDEARTYGPIPLPEDEPGDRKR